MGAPSIKERFDRWLHSEAEMATVRTAWVAEQCEQAYRAGRRDVLNELKRLALATPAKGESNG